jgi:hypothetical protein
LGLNWGFLRSGFWEYLGSKDFSSAYVKDLVHYLDKYLTVIEVPKI